MFQCRKEALFKRRPGRPGAVVWPCRPQATTRYRYQAQVFQEGIGIKAQVFQEGIGMNAQVAQEGILDELDQMHSSC